MTDGGAWFKNLRWVKRARKSPLYMRWRSRLPQRPPAYVDDSASMEEAEPVTIAWPADTPKPRVGIVRDFEAFPRWTKYQRFLRRNGFPHELYNLHAHDWLRAAERLDVVIGFVSSEWPHLEEQRRKYWLLERRLGKLCYPSTAHILLYEDKFLEAYAARIFDLPFARTWTTHDRADALRIVETAPYPLVSKTVPGSGSAGVRLLENAAAARRFVEQAFSRLGRKTHRPGCRQNNYVYFQEYVPNDGYDLRVAVVGERAFGYYRQTPPGDFRASGMNLVEKRALPEDALRIAWRVNEVVRSPMLAVDMVRGLDGAFRIVEFSPVFAVETPMQLMVDGVPGSYVREAGGAIRFEPGRYWVHELALREFFLTAYLPQRRGLGGGT